MKYASEDLKEKALTKNQWIIERQQDLLLVFSVLLKNYPNFVHAFSTRQGGHSKPPFHHFNIGINQTTDENVREDARKNREILCHTLNLPHTNLKTANKLVHSPHVVMLENVGQPEEVDGIATKKLLSPIYMTFADCVPIIIYDPVKHAFCLVHAGWRGTASGISKEAVRFMVEKCASKVNDLICAVGPAIGACCYPVGLEAAEKLLSSLIKEEQVEIVTVEIERIKKDIPLGNWSILKGDQLTEKTQMFWSLIEKLDLKGFFILGSKQIQVDLKAINANQMLSLGVEQVDVTDLCTSCKNELFYSYRRAYVNNEGPTGRQAAIGCLL